MHTKIPIRYLFLVTMLIFGAFVINESEFVFSSDYYQSATNLCGYYYGTTSSCGTFNNFCAQHYYFSTLSCIPSASPFACAAETTVDSCAICGDCAGGGVDTCNIAACGTTYKCAGGNVCNGQGKGSSSYCVAKSGYGGDCYCDAQCSTGIGCNASSKCGLKDINYTLTGGQTSISYGAPPLPTSQCINATGQTASYGIINVTSNSTYGTEAIQLKISATHENIDIVCSSSAGCSGTTLTTSYQTIIASLAQGSQAYIWCWANYNTPTTVGTTPTTYIQPA